jgi:ribosomal protein S18 acetylase RimI-like enzyme
LRHELPGSSFDCAAKRRESRGHVDWIARLRDSTHRDTYDAFVTTEIIEPGRVEEVLLLCTAPVEQVAYDGWLVRRAVNDRTKRARSINAFYGSTRPLAEKLAHCEKLYAEAGLEPLFRLTPFSRPANLDASLGERGYELFEPSFVQVTRLNRPFPTAPDGVRFESMILERWLELTRELRGLSQRQVEAEFSRLHNGEVPGYCSIAYAGDEPVACGLVMHEQDLAGLADIVVAEPYRNRGIGTAISAHLLETARRMGGQVGWLTVLQTNASALAAYKKLGFQTLYEYWYRVKPQASA